jgi:hypothetical protein
MKYLRSIFERLTDDEYYELKEECETYLAYLLDDDFEVDMSKELWNNGAELFDIDIRNDNDRFLWDDVKDQVIPLIELFRKGHFKYKLEKVILYFVHGAKREIRNDEDLDKVQTSGFEDELICLTIKIKI